MPTPLIDYSTWATWQKMYDLAAAPDYQQVRLSYHRAVLYETLAREMADAIIVKLGWFPAWRAAIFGCGFGWVAEHLEKRYGFTNVVGCDISLFVQTNKTLTEEADINAAITLAGLSPLVGEGAALKGRIYDGGPRNRTTRTVLNEDGGTSASRTRIRQALTGGGPLDAVLTEHVLENWADADCQTISAAAHQLGTRVQHFVQVIDRSLVIPEFQVGNWKPTLAEWKALLPNDTFISSGDYQVL